MSPDEFFGKYNGKGVDFDGYYGFQCMDLYRQFCKEVLQVPQSPGVSGAVRVWDTYLRDYFDRIDNSPTNSPIKGDIVIWSKGVGQYGHVAICKDGDSMNFTSFDQNWPVGSLCHFQPHSYKYVLGWLRIKPPVQTVTANTASPEPPISASTSPEVPVTPPELPIPAVDTPPAPEETPQTEPVTAPDQPGQPVVQKTTILSFLAYIIEKIINIFR